jgi:hypothetical protein
MEKNNVGMNRDILHNIRGMKAAIACGNGDIMG